MFTSCLLSLFYFQVSYLKHRNIYELNPTKLLCYYGLWSFQGRDAKLDRFLAIIDILKGYYCSSWIDLMASLKKMKLSKNAFHKKYAPKFLNSADFGTSWKLSTTEVYKIQKFPLKNFVFLSFKLNNPYYHKMIMHH